MRGVSVRSKLIEKLKKSKNPQSVFQRKVRVHLESSLVDAGLFADEAKAMVDTWENGYFKTPGLRILYVLSRYEIERILPVRVSPSPDDLSRVFVGRIELLLDTDEERVLGEILKYRDQYEISQLGRLAHPTLLRVEELAKEKGILTKELSATFDFLISQIS